MDLGELIISAVSQLQKSVARTLFLPAISMIAILPYLFKEKREFNTTEEHRQIILLPYKLFWFRFRIRSES